MPLYLEEASIFLNRKKLNTENIRMAVEIAMSKISPINDIRGSKEYKKLLFRQLIFAHFIELFPDKIQFKHLAATPNE